MDFKANYQPRQSQVLLSQASVMRANILQSQGNEEKEPEFNNELLAYLLSFLVEIVQKIARIEPGSRTYQKVMTLYLVA